MATILDKDIVRESTVKSDDREIVLTISASQEIKMKLKGMKSGEVSIKILDLYNQLTGKSDVEEIVPEVNKKTSISIITRDDKPDKDNPLINLYDLRSLNAISGFDLPTMTKLDIMLAELIKNEKEKKKLLTNKKK